MPKKGNGKKPKTQTKAIYDHDNTAQLYLLLTMLKIGFRWSKKRRNISLTSGARKFITIVHILFAPFLLWQGNG
jgi:hypothetical protein